MRTGIASHFSPGLAALPHFQTMFFFSPRGRRGTQGYSRGSSTRYLKCAHGSTWGTQWDSGALNGCSTTHAPDGATVGTKVVGASVLFMGEGVGAGVGAGVATGVGAGVGEGVTAQRWKVCTARQIGGRCEYPRSTPRVEPARREQCRAPPVVCSGMQPPNDVHTRPRPRLSAPSRAVLTSPRGTPSGSTP